MIAKEILEKMYWKNSMTSWEIASVYGVTHRTILIQMEKQGIPRRPPRSMSINPVLFPTPNLAYILGVMYGDGCSSKYPNTKKPGLVRLRVRSKTFAESFKAALQKIGLNPWINVYCDAEPWYTVHACSEKFCNWYEKLSLESLVDMTNQMCIAFVRGVYESEGSCWATTDGYHLEFSNNNYELLRMTQRFLQGSGYRFNIIPERRCYRMYILGGKKEIERFLAQVNPVIKNVIRFRGGRWKT